MACGGDREGTLGTFLILKINCTGSSSWAALSQRSRSHPLSAGVPSKWFLPRLTAPSPTHASVEGAVLLSSFRAKLDPAANLQNKINVWPYSPAVPKKRAQTRANFEAKKGRWDVGRERERGENLAGHKRCLVWLFPIRHNSLAICSLNIILLTRNSLER